MMKSETNATPRDYRRILTPVLIAVAAIGLLIYLFSLKPQSEKIPDGYYMGVRFNRNTGKFVDGSGKIVPPPPGLENLSAESKSKKGTVP